MKTSLKETKKKITESLSSIGLSQVQTQAELAYISEYILKIPEASQWLDPEQEIPEKILQKIDKLLEKRVQKRIPIQYLVSSAYFYGLAYYVDKNVLIPRPETEHLVDLALEFTEKEGFKSFLDLGTGSGIIPISLAVQLKNQNKNNMDTFKLIGVDISEEALKIAKKNALKHQVQADIQWITGDLFQNLSKQGFDMILSNPPFIQSSEALDMLPEVLQHEPHLALFTPDGKPSFYQRIAQDAKQYLNPNGIILLELGDHCASHAKEAFKNTGFSSIDIKNDYADIERVLIAKP